MAYLPLSTANLPSPVIDPAQGASPEDYFGTLTYDGSGSTQTVTGLNFEPNFVWIKSRSNATGHALHDSVRGDTKLLYSNTTDAEGDWSGTGNGMVQFVDGGFELSGGSVLDGGGRTYVAWNWKANGSGVTNNVGSITSTVSANTTSGFSIVSYTGNGVDNSTVGHGLSQTPEMIIVKSRSLVADWPVYHKDVVTTDKQYLYLDTTAGLSSAVNEFWDVASISATTFGLGDNPRTNNNTSTYIAYCFHSVEGFSKFGSYVGNGSTDGPFVYCGFRPAFVIIKSSSNATDWEMWDSERDSYNVMEKGLEPNTADTEATGRLIDFLSNGFKLRNNNNTKNASGYTYIYMAFAENPFKYSNAR